MARVVNVRTEQKKKELKGLLEQVDASSWNNEPADSPLAEFEREREEFRERFIKEQDIDNSDESVLFAICKILKKKIKKPIDEELCELVEAANTCIIHLSAKGHCVKNEFYYKTNEIWKTNDDDRKYKFLKKNSKYWLNELQTAIKTQNYDLISNSMSLMLFFSNYIWDKYYKE